MNILILCSSYPSTHDDGTGSAGLFIRDFALALSRLGHRVVVQPVARKRYYAAEPEFVIEPLPWLGGDREFASLNLMNPVNWLTLAHFFPAGMLKVLQTAKTHDIQYVFSFWAVPSGIFGWFLHRTRAIPYDVWALGSDIWRIRNIPIVGRKILSSVFSNAESVYADGVKLCREVTKISGRACAFLPSSRRLPEPRSTSQPQSKKKRTQILFVGRYQRIKGPDLLLEAIALLPDFVVRNIHVRMFGFGPLKSDLMLLRQKLGLAGTVDIHGHIDSQDLSDSLNCADFLVIPSRIESIPLVFSDAMQMKTPVISMPVGDMRDIIKKYGCGEVAPDISARGLARAMHQAVEKGPHAYAEGVLEPAEDFDVDRTAQIWASGVTNNKRSDSDFAVSERGTWQ